MVRKIVLLMFAALAAASLVNAGFSEQWKPANGQLFTRWAKEISPEKVLPEYPRPQMVRKQWMNLNGLWSIAFTGKDDPEPSSFDRQIMVPYPVESALSGVMRRVEAKDRMWYKRKFDVPPSWKGHRVLLHFGAVDWESEVIVNGKEIGRHKGGYDPFTYDITSVIKPGDQELVVNVWDPTTEGNQPVGKQSLSPAGCFYTPCSGIWQTVWLEAVPQTYISSFRVIPDIDKSCLRIKINSVGRSNGVKVTAIALDKGKQIASITGKPEEEMRIPLKNAKLWSPSSPFLYDLKIKLESATSKDQVDSYFAMRKVSIGPDAKGITRMLLNNKFVFQLGPLDQGYWPESNYTPPTEGAILYDLQTLKESGFNMIRKHIKVEPERWYYWCDKMGFVVWQDMPCLPTHEVTAEGKVNYESELERVMGALYNHPSIIMWVPFNEAWGQFDTPRIVEKIGKLDPYRLIDNASGWIDNKVGDVVDIHGYPGPRSVKPEAKRAAVIGEFGGLGMIYKDHIWNKDGWGYDLLQNKEDLAARYEKLFRDLQQLVDNPGVSAAVYTQVSDIEGEINGLMTYDRAIVKIDPIVAANASKYLFPPTKTGEADKFIGDTEVVLNADGAKIRYTTDGSNPTKSSTIYNSPIKLTQSTIIKAAAFLPDGSVSRTATFKMTKVEPKPSKDAASAKPGLQLCYYEGSWQNLPEFDKMNPRKTYIAQKIDMSVAQRSEGFALKFEGFITVPETGVYTFCCTSDDCGTLVIDGETVIDDRISHGGKDFFGSIGLAKGAHSVVLLYSQGSGGRALRLGWAGPEVPSSDDPRQRYSEVPSSAMSFVRTVDMQCLPPVPAGYTLLFVGETDAAITCPYKDAAIYYTTDGTEPTESSNRYTAPIHLNRSTTIKAKAYMDGLAPSEVSTFNYTSETPNKAVANDNIEPGLTLSYYDKGSDGIPDISSWSADKTFEVNSLDFPELPKSERYCTMLDGYISVPKTGVYAFYLHGDDVARLIIADKIVIDKAPFFEAQNKGDIVIEAGLHPFKIIHTQGGGSSFVELQIEGPGMSKHELGLGMVYRSK